MFPNLEAEQARNMHTNEYVANKLGMSRQLYEKKKKSGSFKQTDIERLLAIYGATYKYLFSREPIKFVIAPAPDPAPGQGMTAGTPTDARAGQGHHPTPAALSDDIVIFN